MEAGVPQGAPESPNFFSVSTLPLDYNFLYKSPLLYSPWYCDDQVQVVVSRGRRRGRHKFILKRAINSQNKFERSRGIITCAEKSLIIPIQHGLHDKISVDTDGTKQDYPIMQNNSTTKILGLTISKSSFTAHHIKQTKGIIGNEMVKLYSLKGLNFHSKKVLVNSLIISRLTYPVTPLNTVSMSNMVTLQTAQNKALKFLLDLKWQDMVTAEEMHHRAELKPINQVIHNRAKIMWEKITSGQAADANIAREITNIPYTEPKKFFPSSYNRSLKPEPPPMYTSKDTRNPQIKLYHRP